VQDFSFSCFGSGLHGLWDTGLITKAIRELHNYTRPLPSCVHPADASPRFQEDADHHDLLRRQIESALHGSIYDPYVRFILWEGVRVWWRQEIEEWLACPATSSLPSSDLSRTQTVFSSPRKATGDRYGTPGVPSSCAMTWSGPTHLFDCSHVFPPDYDPQEKPLRELNTPAYYGKIRGDKVIEKLLAKAGLRLAAVLNDIFASEEDKNMGMIANWMEVVDGKRPFLVPDLV
jgi:hypothetical protein